MALDWPSLCSPARPQGHRGHCLCLLSTGIQVLCWHIQWGMGLFETVSHYVAQANLKLVVFWPQPPRFQDYRYLPLYSAKILDSLDFIKVIFTSNLKCSGRKTNFFFLMKNRSKQDRFYYIFSNFLYFIFSDLFKSPDPMALEFVFMVK